MKFSARIHQLVPTTTALWAFSESGLGGVLHAIKLPFSGIVLGGISVILITFLAYNSTQRWKTVIQAMLLVLLLKAMISPHTPVMAYVAVSFQGLLGATIYYMFGVNRFSAMAFGCIALVESAFQKVLTLTILFGVQIWEAFSTFFDGLTEKFGIKLLHDLPLIVLISYGLLYAIAGILAGYFAFKLPQNILKTAEILKGVEFNPINTTEINRKKRGRVRKVLIFMSLLFFIATVFVISGQADEVWYILIRTLIVLFAFLFIVNPLVKYLLNKWVKKKKVEEQKRLTQVLDQMPRIRQNAVLANQLTAKTRNPITRVRNFVLVWFTLSLYFEEI